MATTRRGAPLGPGRVDPAKLKNITEADVRRYMVEDGFDPDVAPGEARHVVPVAVLRRRTGLTQEKFASALRIPVRTLRNWEQGQSRPDPVVLSLLELVADDPDRAFRVLRTRRDFVLGDAEQAEPG